MNREQLNTILKNHLHWIIRDCKGWEDMRADLCEADLRGVDIREENLYEANLRGANLRGANLRFANLCGANLYRADLCGADLYGANLHGAYLRETNLCGADLRESNLYGASLCRADLYGANLRRANLCGVYLDGTDLREADLRFAKGIPFIPMVCPEEGAFIGYKRAKNKIVKLEICSDARRSSATGRKCRCDKAKVLSITKLNGSPTFKKEVSSDYDRDFIYRVGEIVEEPNFCEDRFNECACGIHFFINRQEAVEY